jgi:hypothetical protein
VSCLRRAGFAESASRDVGVLWQLVLARINRANQQCRQRAGKAETSIDLVSYRTIKRRLPVYATRRVASAAGRCLLPAACAVHIGVEAYRR